MDYFFRMLLQGKISGAAGSVLSLSLVPLFSCFFVFYVQHSIFSTSTFHNL